MCLPPVYINFISTPKRETINGWKKVFLEKGPELFAQEGMVADYERRIAELERLLGQKEVEIALLKNFWGRRP